MKKFFFQNSFFLTFIFLLLLALSYQQEIGVDIMPASHYIMNKQDLQRLRDEINHDFRKRISNIEESWQANEAIREVSSGVWNLQGSSYPSVNNNNGLGGLGQQAMKEYWENYAKAVDPLNFNRKLKSKADETHAEATTDKIEDSMSTINENINRLKASIKRSNEAAQSKSDIQRPKSPLLEKNPSKNTEKNIDNTEENIISEQKNEESLAKPNEATQKEETLKTEEKNKNTNKEEARFLEKKSTSQILNGPIQMNSNLFKESYKT